MIQVALDSHCLDAEFEAQLAAAGIAVVDRTDEPWCVIFEGRRDVLIDFVREHWGCETYEDAVALVDDGTLEKP